jgi:hypothetical protein
MSMSALSVAMEAIRSPRATAAPSSTSQRLIEPSVMSYPIWGIVTR